MPRYQHREFLLDKFPISIDQPTSIDRLKFTWFPFKRNPFFFYTKLTLGLNHRLYMDQSLPYNPAFHGLGPDCFLFGYFQSEKYFMDYDYVISQDFSYQPDLFLYDPEVRAAVGAPGSTAIQFRRGDYVTNPAANRTMGVCPIEYYERALAYIASCQNHVQLLVFSDDIQWCKENVRFDNAVFVERKGGSPVDDMFVAAKCDNIILANSTFSWWCAWLNKNPQKIIVAPQKWFREKTLNELAYDLIPKSWVRL
jgi:hypothetical protein